MKTTVIHHSADFDGLFCREIARKFLPDAELIGWDFKDKPLPMRDDMLLPNGMVYILDLPVDRVFGDDFSKSVFDEKVKDGFKNIIWIDHHASSIASHPPEIPGYRIDGVAACRLAWAYFTRDHTSCPGCPACLPNKQNFIDLTVSEPLAVRLAGLYDVWDRRDPRAEVFQFGLRSKELTAEDWSDLLAETPYRADIVNDLLRDGELLQRYQQGIDKGTMHKSFLIDFEGLKFLALNTARCNSLTFASKDVPETSHDALMGFYWDGEKWNVSLYHAEHRKDIDLSAIAVKHGGGGHKGACGFNSTILPFIP